MSSLVRAIRASAPTARKTLCVVPSMGLQYQPSRSFFNSTSLKSAAPATNNATAAKETSFSDIVNQYGGWYPFAALAGVVAISKEYIILNTEAVLVSNFAAVVGMFYLTLGDVLGNAREEQANEVKKKFDDLYDFQIEQLNALIVAHEANASQVDILKGLKAEYNELAGKVVAAKQAKLKAAAQASVIQRLQSVKAREAAEAAELQQMVLEAARAHAWKAAKDLPAAAKAQLVDRAIGFIEGKSEDSVDPIKQIYIDYIKARGYEADVKAKINQKRAERAAKEAAKSSH